MGMQSGKSAMPALNALDLLMRGVGNHARADGTRKQDEEKARLAEIEGKEAEHRQREKNKKTKQKLDEQQRRARAQSKALWGQAGVAMNGTPLAVQFGRRTEDSQRMHSLLSEGQDRLDAIGSSARHKAEEARRKAALRTGNNNSVASPASILSMGANIFKEGSRGYHSDEA